MTLANNGTEDQSPPKNAQIKPCRLVVCNLSTYDEVIKHATANLIKDGNNSTPAESMKVVNITQVMIKLQFKLPQALISRGFTQRTVFHAPAFQQKRINRLVFSPQRPL